MSNTSRSGATELAWFRSLSPEALAFVIDVLDARSHAGRHAIGRKVARAYATLGRAVLEGTDPTSAVAELDEVLPLTEPRSGSKAARAWAVASANLVADGEEALSDGEDRA